MKPIVIAVAIWIAAAGTATAQTPGEGDIVPAPGSRVRAQGISGPGAQSGATVGEPHRTGFEIPAMVKIDFDRDGKIFVAKRQPDLVLQK